MTTNANGASPLTGIRKRDLTHLLETDKRVREWIEGGGLLGALDAADLLEVERPRIWKLVKYGRLTPIVQLKATPLFMRRDIEALKAALDAERAKRARNKAEREAKAAA